ncbi:MAG: ABC transporter permease subunit [Propionibacteriaceae bacterium]|jgi:D-methionine transport system permease protein|nr:ABC transporter permease subunit [Propionibacteriaceae bacterium]
MRLLENTWNDWLTQTFWTSLGQTLQMIGFTLIIGGGLGLLLGLTLFATRRGGLAENRIVYVILSVLVNIIRPIPFIIFMTAIRPLTMAVMGGYIGTIPAIFPMVIMCSMATSRLVEQSLIAADPGVIEAGRAMGASRLHILTRILVPEALAPLILGYTFLFVGILDLSVMAGVISGGGLGQFALSDGYRKFNDLVTLVSIVVMIIMVQCVQLLGNGLARLILRRR